MIIDLSGVDNTPKMYIKEEGYYTLKCIDVKQHGRTKNDNPIYKFYFQNKDGELYIEDVIITDNTKWKIKQMADAFGFTYDRVNIFNFIGLYLVGNLVQHKVTNKVGQIVDTLACKSFAKSAKLINEIPAEGKVPVTYETMPQGNDIPDISYDDSEIPF